MFDLYNSLQKHSLGFILLLMLVVPAFAQAQKPSASSRNKQNVNPVELDKKVEEAATAFMNTAADVALEYEEAGDLDKAQEILRKILMLQPNLDKVRAKIKELEEKRLEKNDVSVELDPSKGWISAGVGVNKGDKVRFASEGESRVIISQKIDSQGFPAEDIKTDLATGVPLGALMGVVVNRKGKLSPPFLIGKKSELAMPQQGQLLLRINVPASSKCTGKIRIKITGEIQIPKK